MDFKFEKFEDAWDISSIRGKNSGKMSIKENYRYLRKWVRTVNYIHVNISTRILILILIQTFEWVSCVLLQPSYRYVNEIRKQKSSSLTYQHDHIRHHKNVIFTSCVQVWNPFHSICRSYSNSSLLMIKLRIQIIRNFSMKTKKIEK